MKQADPTLALSVYLRANVPNKVMSFTCTQGRVGCLRGYYESYVHMPFLNIILSAGSISLYVISAFLV